MVEEGSGKRVLGADAMKTRQVDRQVLLRQWERAERAGMLRPIKRCPKTEQALLSLLGKRGEMRSLGIMVELESQGFRSVLDAIRHLFAKGKIQLLYSKQSFFLNARIR